jgi:dihydroorotate dehydrogenase electron transfer subunit
MKRVNIRFMGQGSGELVEKILEGGLTGGVVSCPVKLVPPPGQYLLAHELPSVDPLPVPVFMTASHPVGFLAAAPLPEHWAPGTKLSLRGPLGRGFDPPGGARRVALMALGSVTGRLLPLMRSALEDGAAVVLVVQTIPGDIPAEVEIRPTSAAPEVAAWADYLAIDLERDSLPEVLAVFSGQARKNLPSMAQVLVSTDMPCGGLGECGVCAVRTRKGWKLACKHGPVFALSELP